MSTLTIFIVALFVLGYLSIALESVTKINKAAVALLMFVGCWTLFMFNPVQYPDVAELLPSFGNNVAQTVSNIIERHLGSTATTLFFLMGARTRTGASTSCATLCRRTASASCCGALRS